MTFGRLLRSSEYRALFLSGVLSWLGEYLARTAVVVLVYQETRSALLAAAAFAVGYAPWLIMSAPGVLAATTRLPSRSVLLLGHALQCAFLPVLLIPGLPVVGAMFALFAMTLAAVPAQTARSSILPLTVGREQLPMAVTANARGSQIAQIAGFLLGATGAVVSGATTVFVVCGLLFAIVTALVFTGARTGLSSLGHTDTASESSGGFRLVFLDDPLLRSIALLVFTISAVAVVPEGLAVVWAMQGDRSSASGLTMGLLMAAGPVGFFLGGLVLNHAIPPHRRDRLVPLFAIGAPALLVPILVLPSISLSSCFVLASGMAQGCLLPILNARFVLALPQGARARAFRTVQLGLQASQAGGVLLAGLLAACTSPHAVVGWWAVAGTAFSAYLATRLSRALPRAEQGQPDDDDPGTDSQPWPDGHRTGRERPRGYRLRRPAPGIRPDRRRPRNSVRPSPGRADVARRTRPSPIVPAQRAEGTVLVALYEDLWAITLWDETTRAHQPLQVRDRPQEPASDREGRPADLSLRAAQRRAGPGRPPAAPRPRRRRRTRRAFLEGLAATFSFGMPVREPSSAALMDEAVANIADAARRVGRAGHGD